MKLFERLSLVTICTILALAALSSCEWDTSEEPDHPLYVTYTISAGSVMFIGPDILLVDIQAWIRANQNVYDKSVNYTSGDLSEFEKTDKDAVKKYEEFAPKFKKYLEDELMTDLKAGKYDDPETNTPATVQAVFYISASRAQGPDGHLKYEEVKFSYP